MFGLYLDSQIYSIGLCVYPYASTIHLDYYSLLVGFEIRKCESSNFILLFQDCFVYPRFHMNFRIILSISAKMAARILMVFVLNLQISLGNIAILTILNLPVVEHDMSFFKKYLFIYVVGCAGSVVVAHGLSCSAACGIFPDQG